MLALGTQIVHMMRESVVKKWAKQRALYREQTRRASRFNTCSLLYMVIYLVGEILPKQISAQSSGLGIPLWTVLLASFIFVASWTIILVRAYKLKCPNCGRTPAVFMGRVIGDPNNCLNCGIVLRRGSA